MSESRLLLSLPSSGSDWLAGAVARATGWRYWEKEFFNPICNPIPEIEDGFGCEMVSRYHFIAQPKPTEAAYQAWRKRGFEFNKEVFCAFNVPWFADRFECFALIRRYENTFPPKRARVLSWYDAIWNSCRDAGLATCARSLADRVKEAHELAAAHLKKECAKRSLFVIEYERLCDRDYVEEVSLKIDSSKANVIAKEIVDTWKKPNS